MRCGSNSSSRALSLRRLEILQVRRRLVIAGGHEVAVSAEEVVLLADDDLIVALHARALVPFRPWIGVAAKRLVDAPWPRQSVVVDGDLVVQDVGIVLVEMKALLEHRLVVEGERQAGGVVGARPLEATRLDAEQRVAALRVGLRPLADR